jgi:hypothetical protein
VIPELGYHMIEDRFVPVDDEHDFDRIVGLGENALNGLDEMVVSLAVARAGNDRDLNSIQNSHGN